MINLKIYISLHKTVTLVRTKGKQHFSNLILIKLILSIPTFYNFYGRSMFFTPNKNHIIFFLTCEISNVLAKQKSIKKKTTKKTKK
jgi:hypothetical protein